eukprot:CAMPEP_0202865264 /NCGR_PEP_ID=MMETSP1391-20130828/5494_1 /ASSEMBLY_ACC=CAM_ASM_000867 /TAXON_ID=1034604 /ORGANISM="Chlamydomonas leiostraca, Strain SAG 11-49" /LENGTH=314 /DNA_ID=CAMNT_0049545085 /DNA_START=114 /DNA_END=1058 /DNA_ORIENTATION=+
MTIKASATAKNGDFVKVHYTGTLDDGSVFDTSRKRGTPLEFMVGGGMVIKGFDKAVTGLAVGESRKERVAPEDAYGHPDPGMVLKFPAAQAPEGLKAGMQVQLSNGMIAKCTKLDDKEVELDLNHELAGKSLTFDVELMALTPAERLGKATFGMGCFWGPELVFQRVPGVVTTEVGYSNGNTEEPTYEEVCSGKTGHCEVVQVTYDNGAVTYEELLDVFWEKHDPTTLNRQGADQGTQYRSGIYAHSEEQKAAAEKSKAARQGKVSAPIVTEVVSLSKYYTAEPYHQQYLARGGRFGKSQNPAKGCNDPIRCYG